jgi:hypothetical protein
MTIKLQHKGTYFLKGVEKPITLRKNKKGQFWYVDCKDRNKTVYVTEEDVVGQTYISYNDLELKVGDIVLYIKSLWNGGATVALGQVEELKGVRAKVRFEDDKTSNIAPDNLFVVTDSRIRETYKWLK